MSVQATDAPLHKAAARAAMMTGLIVCMLALGSWAWSPPTIAMGVLLLAFVAARPLARVVYQRVLRPPVAPGQVRLEADSLHFDGPQDGWSVAAADVAGLVASPILTGVVDGSRLSIYLRGGASRELCLEGPQDDREALLAKVSQTLGQPLQ